MVGRQTRPGLLKGRWFHLRTLTTAGAISKQERVTSILLFLAPGPLLVFFDSRERLQAGRIPVKETWV